MPEPLSSYGVFNIASAMTEAHIGAGRGDDVALVTDDGGVLSYRQLDDLSRRVGNLLRAIGVVSEQRVAIALQDGPEFVATFLGALKIGAVPVPVNTQAPDRDLAHFLSWSRARALVAEAAIADRAIAQHDADGDPLAIIAVGSRQARTAHVDFERAVAAESADLATYPTRPDEPSYWLFSSGTTGLPKAVVHLQRDMIECVLPYAREIVAITGADRTFSIPRLFFSYGLVNSLYLPLLTGASAVLSRERPTTAAALGLIARREPTLLFSVPTALAQLCATLETDPRARAALASVRLVVSAGEALPAPLYERWRSLTGIELLDGLGSTEVGYIYCSQRAGSVRPGSSGRPVATHEMKLIDEDGRVITQPDTPGELWVKAASTAPCYWNDQERTRRTFVGEWLRTGDRYRRDAAGFYWNLGRQDDVFKVNGQWVSPIEVESCLLTHPAVAECALVGYEDEVGLLKPMAFVVLRGSASVTAVELQEYVRARLLPHVYPRRIEFLTELPKTATGKIQRFKLRSIRDDRPR